MLPSFSITTLLEEEGEGFSTLSAQEEIPSRELCTNMKVIKIGTPKNISVSSQSLREIIRVIFEKD